ncbi:MAG: efflux RND transporter periplasmic adaptor subunit [Burkholderiales bacterium]
MKNKRNSTPAIVFAAVFLLVTSVTAIFCSETRAAEEKKAAPRPALTVTTTRPSRAAVPLKLAANGNIVAWQDASVGSEANGLRLKSVAVNVGDQVKTGQVLASFAADTVEADVALARANVLEAKAAEADARATAERAQTLKETGAMSEQQINQYSTAGAVAAARVQAAQAQLRVQQLRRRHTEVRSPDDGIISSRSATVGAVLPAGTELFRLIRKGRLEWRAEVTSAELERIKPGNPVLLTAASGAQIRGKVRTIAPTVDPKTRTALVYVDLDPKASTTGAARAGMFARGEFDLGSSSALTVPQQAVVLRDGFNYVFKVEDGERVRQTKVDVGRRFGDRVEIQDGLAPDANVVATGAGFLNDGDLVRVVPATSGSAETGAAAAAASASPPGPASSGAAAK